MDTDGDENDSEATESDVEMKDVGEIPKNESSLMDIEKLVDLTSTEAHLDIVSSEAREAIIDVVGKKKTNVTDVTVGEMCVSRMDDHIDDVKEKDEEPSLIWSPIDSIEIEKAIDYGIHLYQYTFSVGFFYVW